LEQTQLCLESRECIFSTPPTFPLVESPMSHPLRSLLYIEWILFAVVMTLEVSPHQVQSIDPKWLNIGIVAVLAAMGLRLPLEQKLSIRVIYTIAQIILILIAAGVGMRPAVMLYIIVVIRSYLIFDQQYRLWLTAGIFGLYLMTMNLFPNRRLPPHSGENLQNRTDIQTVQTRSPGTNRHEHRDGFRWGFVVLFGGILFSLQLLIDRILAEKQAKEELAIANQRIRSYALKAEENGSLQERNRIAREIHDSLGHSLTALNLHLEMAVKLAQIKPEKSLEVLIEAKRLGSTALKDVRQSVSTLRSDPLQKLDLPVAINQLADEFQLSNHVRPQCYLNVPLNLPQPIATTIYRLVQEALTNISKYAQASEIIIEIQTLTTELKLQIVDNGCGFIPSNNMTGFGLQGMRERVLSLHGKFEIISTTDTDSDLLQPSGCQIVAIIPLS
jgi:signal transduction histidine kinase